MFCSNAIDTVKMTLLCFEGGKPTIMPQHVERTCSVATVKMKLLCFEGGKPTNKTCTILFKRHVPSFSAMLFYCSLKILICT